MFGQMFNRIGQQRRTVTRGNPVVFGIISVLIIGGCGWLQWHEAQIYHDLKRDHQVINAPVTSKNVSYGRHSTTYYLYITYQVAGQPYQQSVSVSYDRYLNTAMGSTITIIYYPGNPKEYQVGTTPRMNYGPSIGGLFGVLFFGISLFIRRRFMR